MTCFTRRMATEPTGPNVTATSSRERFMLKNLHGRAADFIFAAPLTVAFIVMFVFFALRGEGFFNAENLENVALQSAALCIVGVAIGLVMIAGYIDLSVG